MSGVARLVGARWGRWRGGWTGDLWLAARGGEWRLHRGGRLVGRWPSFATAVADLWPRRTRRDHRPWAVGWLGYEECAALGGGLPARRGDGGSLSGWWLVEPCRMDTGAISVPGGPAAEVGVATSLGTAAFEAGVRSIRARIARGDVYQVNLTRRFRVSGWRGGVAGLCEEAVRGGAPDYLAWIEFADGELLCASMELLLRRRGDHLETGPIKGTRRRGVTPAEDDELARQLAADPKERAELTMVVDLERNDLGRVAIPGTVRVEDPGSVHRYGTVQHLVARVTARAPASRPWWELLRVVAPGGSVTGCPKWSAMQVIRDLEPVGRGPYTGALGVVDGTGDLEVALPIRTAWRAGSSLEFAAGCGVVWDSVPHLEEEESRLKVARWLDLVAGPPVGRRPDRGRPAREPLAARAR